MMPSLEIIEIAAGGLEIVEVAAQGPQGIPGELGEAPGAVRCDVAQTLTEEQINQAQANLELVRNWALLFQTYLL